eukprot:1159654-Pelagomonas_calceolata.AAC.2
MHAREAHAHVCEVGKISLGGHPNGDLQVQCMTNRQTVIGQEASFPPSFSPHVRGIGLVSTRQCGHAL